MPQQQSLSIAELNDRAARGSPDQSQSEVVLQGRVQKIFDAKPWDRIMIILADETGSCAVDLPRSSGNRAFLEASLLRVSGTVGMDSKTHRVRVRASTVQKLPHGHSSFQGRKKRRQNSFPRHADPVIRVVTSKSASAMVYEDFLRALAEAAGNARHSLDVRPINILDGDQILAAIRDDQAADILVMIRGGGDHEQFLVFNRPDIVEAFSGLTHYRVTGLGHSGNGTELDAITDYAATTPAAAGAHVGQQLAQQALLRDHAALSSIPAEPPQLAAPANTRRSPFPALIRRILKWISGGVWQGCRVLWRILRWILERKPVQSLVGLVIIGAAGALIVALVQWMTDAPKPPEAPAVTEKPEPAKRAPSKPKPKPKPPADTPSVDVKPTPALHEEAQPTTIIPALTVSPPIEGIAGPEIETRDAGVIDAK